MIRGIGLICVLAMVAAVAGAVELPAPPQGPVRLIFDTDMGNDVDDALALGMIHALQSRGECELLAVTITKDHSQCAAYIDAVNTFYGRGDIPIGVCRPGPTPEQSKFTVLADVMDNGKYRYPHDLLSGKDALEAVEVLRTVLSAQPDRSVAIAQVGFSTNLARLLDSKPDTHSSLDGRALVAQKAYVLAVMAGAFAPIEGKEHLEYNVVKDIPAAQKLAGEWPTPIVYSGFEIGIALPYPAVSIDRDFAYVQHHILAESYQLYMPTPHERPTWDLTAVLWAIRPDRGYFGLSEPGRVTVSEKGRSAFAPSADGPHRYLTLNQEQIVRTREALALLASQPPDARAR